MIYHPRLKDISRGFLIFWVRFVWCGAGVQIKNIKNPHNVHRIYTQMSALFAFLIFFYQAHTRGSLAGSAVPTLLLLLLLLRCKVTHTGVQRPQYILIIKHPYCTWKYLIFAHAMRSQLYHIFCIFLLITSNRFVYAKKDM